MPNNTDFNKDAVNEMPETEFKPIPVWELDKQVKNSMNEFSELLNSLDKSLDKKKTLWKQIYENAVTDRKTAYLVFADLYVAVHSRSAEHAIHGPTLSKYMERMSKSTDQLLKLAELVAAADEKSGSSVDEPINEDDIYNAVKNKKSSH